MAVDARYRDKDGEISRKHGNTLIGTLRISYGSGFAKDSANDEKLSDVLAKLDEYAGRACGPGRQHVTIKRGRGNWMNRLYLSWFATIKLGCFLYD